MKLALFDLDGTLIAKDSDHAFGEFLVGLGWADGEAFKRENDFFYQQYLAGTLDIDAYVDFATRPWRDRSDAEQAHDRGALHARSDAGRRSARLPVRWCARTSMPATAWRSPRRPTSSSRARSPTRSACRR